MSELLDGDRKIWVITHTSVLLYIPVHASFTGVSSVRWGHSLLYRLCSWVERQSEYKENFIVKNFELKWWTTSFHIPDLVKSPMSSPLCLMVVNVPWISKDSNNRIPWHIQQKITKGVLLPHLLHWSYHKTPDKWPFSGFQHIKTLKMMKTWDVTCQISKTLS